MDIVILLALGVLVALFVCNLYAYAVSRDRIRQCDYCGHRGRGTPFLQNRQRLLIFLLLFSLFFVPGIIYFLSQSRNYICHGCRRTIVSKRSLLFPIIR